MVRLIARIDHLAHSFNFFLPLTSAYRFALLLILLLQLYRLLLRCSSKASLCSLLCVRFPLSSPRPYSFLCFLCNAASFVDAWLALFVTRELIHVRPLFLTYFCGHVHLEVNLKWPHSMLPPEESCKLMHNLLLTKI